MNYKSQKHNQKQRIYTCDGDGMIWKNHFFFEIRVGQLSSAGVVEPTHGLTPSRLLTILINYLKNVTPTSRRATFSEGGVEESIRKPKNADPTSGRAMFSEGESR